MHSNKYIAPVKVPRKRKKQSKGAVPVKEIMPFVWHMYEQNQELVRENERLRCELDNNSTFPVRRRLLRKQTELILVRRMETMTNLRVEDGAIFEDDRQVCNAEIAIENVYFSQNMRPAAGTRGGTHVGYGMRAHLFSIWSI